MAGQHHHLIREGAVRARENPTRWPYKFIHTGNGQPTKRPIRSLQFALGPFLSNVLRDFTDCSEATSGDMSTVGKFARLPAPHPNASAPTQPRNEAALHGLVLSTQSPPQQRPSCLPIPLRAAVLAPPSWSSAPGKDISSFIARFAGQHDHHLSLDIQSFVIVLVYRCPEFVVDKIASPPHPRFQCRGPNRPCKSGFPGLNDITPPLSWVTFNGTSWK